MWIFGPARLGRFARLSLTVPETTHEPLQFPVQLPGDSEQILGGIIPWIFVASIFVVFGRLDFGYILGARL